MNKLHVVSLILGAGLLVGVGLVLATDRSQAKAQDRGGIFASWSPDQISALRKRVGLIGPGPQSKYPEARFPAYLSKYKTVDDLMPAARAAVTQTAGRVPLGLANAGDEVLI